MPAIRCLARHCNRASSTRTGKQHSTQACNEGTPLNSDALCHCRGLQGLLNQRRKLLSYLRRDNFPRYAFVIYKLGLKDTYAKQVSRGRGIGGVPVLQHQPRLRGITDMSCGV